jgi:hypothetical protein
MSIVPACIFFVKIPFKEAQCKKKGRACIETLSGVFLLRTGRGCGAARRLEFFEKPYYS